MSIYTSWKSSVLGKVIGDGQCVSLVVNNEQAYVEALYPGAGWESIIPPVGSAKDLTANAQYFETIINDHNNANQVPVQGDIMVFGATPASGYTNTFNNPDGHCGVCDSASNTGYALLQQNSPSNGSPANVKSFPWKFRPCEKWFHPTSSPVPTPSPSGQTITLPKTTGPWHLYAPGFAGNMAHVLGLIEPEVLHEDLTYAILESLGNGVYRIKSEDYGIGDLFTKGSDVIIK
jgi:hypothetical protein